MYLPYHWRFFDKNFKIKTAKEFYLNNDYSGKIANITYDGFNGSLNKVLQKEFGFKLKLPELKEVHKLVKEQKKSKGLRK